MVLLGGRMNRNQKGSHLSCCNSPSLVQWGISTMSGFDWRSEQAYANFEKAETVDIAWEWLRRDSEYHKDYGALATPARLNGATDDFRHKWGLSFRS
jgi:Proteobacterial transcriptional regulator-like domain